MFVKIVVLLCVGTLQFGHLRSRGTLRCELRNHASVCVWSSAGQVAGYGKEIGDGIWKLLFDPKKKGIAPATFWPINVVGTLKLGSARSCELICKDVS
jgi:hypothetical protein